MNKLRIALLLSCCVQVAAQQLYVYPAGVMAPRGSYQVISAQITGIDNKTVTWRTTGGTLVGTNPCVSANAAPCTIALYSTTPGTYTVAASSNANSSITATSTVTITASPTAITTHPREWMTALSLPMLQAKAKSRNDVWNTLNPSSAISSANTGWLVANGGGGWTCQGGTGVPSAAYVTKDESGGGPEGFVQATLLAFMANIDPNSANRANYTCYAHDMYLYYMTEILKTSCGYGMCNAGTINGNPGGDWGIGIGTTLDWIYSSFTSSEKATILAAHKKAAQMIVTQVVISSGHPDPVGTYNSQALATDYSGVRTTGNNYYATHMAQLAAMSVAWDAADDPTTTNCPGGRNQVCTDGSANSMQAYLHDAVGAYLYSLWLDFDDPAVTTSAYNAQFGSSISPTFTCSQQYDPTLKLPCYGNARGGISHEGVMYMGSMGRLREMFSLMHTAGVDDPMVLGPQLSFATSSWWDLDLQGMLHSMTPAVHTAGGWNFQPLFGYNEINSVYDPVMYNGQTFGDLLWYDQMTGRTDRSNSLGWIVANLTSPQEPYSNSASQNIWFGMSGYLYLPAGSSTYAALGATDPRPSMPMDYYSLNAGNLIAGTGWSSSDAVFGTLNPVYPTQDHEMGPAGRFFFYRNGDWATKGLDGYCDYDNSGTFSECNASYSNTAAYQNSPGIALSGYYLVDAFVTQGGEANHGFGTNATATLQSFMPGYVAQSVNATGAYNFNYPSAYARSDVQNATRDFLWIKPYYVAIYDRGVTGQSAFKQVWFNATGTPAISGTNTSWTSALGSLSVYLHTLLPSGATISNQPFASNIGNQAYGDYAPQTRIEISAGTPTSAQFLNVIEAQNHGAAATGATLVQSTAGQGFDGALIGPSLAMFMRTWPATFTGVTYPASGATTQYISDLTPNTAYNITGAGTPANATTDSAGVLTFSAAGTGNITVGAPAKIGTSAIGTASKITSPALYASAACTVAIIVAACTIRRVR